MPEISRPRKVNGRANSEADQVSVQTRANFQTDQQFTVFGAEDQVNKNFGEGLGHSE